MADPSLEALAHGDEFHSKTREETILQVDHFQSLIKKKNTKVQLTDCSLGTLAKNDPEIISIIKELAGVYDRVTTVYMHDFANVIPQIRYDLYGQYAQEIVELVTEQSLKCFEQLQTVLTTQERKENIEMLTYNYALVRELLYGTALVNLNASDCSDRDDDFEIGVIEQANS